MDERQNLALKLIEQGHAKLSVFAQDSYAMFGRGVALVETAPFSSGDPVLRATGMQYHAVEDVRRMAGPHPDSEWSTLLRMLETYDPVAQAVVMAAVGDGNPVTVKMRLDSPYIVESERQDTNRD